MLNNIRQFFREYKALAFVVVAIVTAAILDLLGQDVAAHWILGVGASVTLVPLALGMVDTIRTGGYGIDILAATAVITAIILGEYWAAIIVGLMLTGGEALEDYAEKRAKSELDSLLTNKPKKAHLLKGNQTIDVAVSKIVGGDKLVILPGEVVPVDAVILEGASSFDDSSITGESLPIERKAGEEILSGSVNTDSSITVKALRPASESQYEQIIKLVKAAASTQSPFVRMADRYSVPFTAAAYLLAGSVWFVTGDAQRFLEVIIVATPCPLLLGAPIALISGMSRAAKHGIIVKTGSALERLAEVRTIAFDKTGTLTSGKPIIDKVETYGKFTRDSVLGYAAALESHSNHILGTAITTAAEEQSVKIPKVRQVKELSGRGLSGRLDGKDVVVGRMSLLEELGVEMPKAFKPKALKSTATHVAINGQLAAIITFRDEIRPEAKKTLARLRRNGIKHFAMITGDNEASAVAVAKELNITDVYPDCLPADKLAAIDEMEHYPVAFVGDGVNDAPVLTAADVGIALGARGSTAASESADIVIMNDDVSHVADSAIIARRTFFIAKQSILMGIFISLGLMAVFATGKFKPIHGALLQEVVDVAVIINALRAHGPWRRPDNLR